MKNSQITCKIILALLVTQIVSFFAEQAVFGQTETLDIIQYSPPAGWTKTIKPGAVVYSDVNKKTSGYCVLTIYSSAATAGTTQKDFANAWKELVGKPFRADANPKTETRNDNEGWQGTVGGATIETDAGLKGIALLTVYSGFGRTASILTILNDETYLAKADAFLTAVKLDKATALAKSAPPIQNDPGTLSTRDPFPDKPNRGPQEPLAGPLKNSITMNDLAGTWSEGGANVISYVNSGTGNYGGTDTTFFSDYYSIKADGAFESRFQGRTGNHTVRETSSGTITLSGGYITLSYTGGERRNSIKYQFVAYMVLPNGGAVLTLIQVADNDAGYSPDALIQVCGHAHAYITCGPGIEWIRKPAK